VAACGGGRRSGGGGAAQGDGGDVVWEEARLGLAFYRAEGEVEKAAGALGAALRRPLMEAVGWRGSECARALVRARGEEEASREREGHGTRGGVGDGRRGHGEEGGAGGTRRPRQVGPTCR
jgi:hypothetical protein